MDLRLVNSYPACVYSFLRIWFDCECKKFFRSGSVSANCPLITRLFVYGGNNVRNQLTCSLTDKIFTPTRRGHVHLVIEFLSVCVISINLFCLGRMANKITSGAGRPVIVLTIMNEQNVVKSNY